MSSTQSSGNANSGASSGASKQAYIGDPPYTVAEKAWLKEHWKDEFHFLQAYQLSIYDEGDRAEGRAIVRAFMQQEATEGE